MSAEINWDEISPDDCVYQGEVYPEHDYGEYECRRCGAEAPYEDDEDDAPVHLPGDDR